MFALVFGLSNAAEANIDLLNSARAAGASVEMTGHSRGGIVLENVTGRIRQDGVTNAPITNIQLNGSAGSAQNVQGNLNQITSDQGQVNQSTHQNDWVGSVIGGNPTTGGLPGGFIRAHGSYGLNADQDRSDQYWGLGNHSISLPALKTPEK